MPMITIIKAMNKRSTMRASIFLLMTRPNTPPKIPDKIIPPNRRALICARSMVKRERTVAVICENKIIYKEFCAASFVCIVKKKYSTTKLIGPPPMPKKEEKIPNIIPMNRQAKILRTR